MMETTNERKSVDSCTVCGADIFEGDEEYEIGWPVWPEPGPLCVGCGPELSIGDADRRGVEDVE